MSGNDSPSRKPVLFVAGNSAHSLIAVLNMRKALARLQRSEESVEIVDVYEEPDRALQWRVFVTPTLVDAADPFRRRLVGDLSSEADLAAFLQ